MFNKAIVFWFPLILLLCFSNTLSAREELTGETRDEIERYLADTKIQYGVVSQALAILKNGKLVFTTAHGLSSVELNVAATEETVYQVFSLAKMFANVMLMQLVESEEIELDAPISEYLDDLPDSWRKITVRQAMSHISGLPEYYKWPNPTPKTQQDAIQSVTSKDMVFETATMSRYNQTNYLLLKMLIERVLQRDFASVATERMINQTGLKNTVYGGEYAVIQGRATTYRSTSDGIKRNVHLDQPDYMFASSGLNTNVLDLAKWFSALLNEQLISRDSLDKMWQPVFLGDEEIADFANGWEYRQQADLITVGHGGGNRTDVRHFLPNGDNSSITVIYLTNGSAKDYWLGGVSAEIASLVRKAETGVPDDPTQ